MDIERPCWRRTLWVLAFAAALWLVAWGSLFIRAQGSAEFGFGGPTPLQIGVGDPPTWVEIVLTGTELYGYQFELTFDPTMLEAVSGEFVSTFLKAEFTPSAWSGTIDNVAGTVRFAATQTWPTPPASGSGVVARVAFRGKWSASLPEYTQLAILDPVIAKLDGIREELAPAFRSVLVIVPVRVSVGIHGECGDGWEPTGCLSATTIISGENLYGYQYSVTFDPARLVASSAGFYHDFMRADLTPPGWSATIDNVAGRVRFAATQEWPALPATGSGAVGWICFSQVGGLTEPVTTTVGVSDPRTATKDGVLLYSTGISDTVTLSPIVAIYGQVEMQGRLNYSRCVASALTTPVTYTTQANGWYTLTVCSGIHTVALEMGRYLDTWRTVTATSGVILLPKVRLLAGDVSDDDLVDIVDMSIIGGKYAQVVNPLTERADVNADGVIDILDITLAAGNYMKVSPVPWP